MNKWVPGWQRLWVAALGLMALGAATVAQAQARIDSISSSIQGGVEVIRIELDQPLAAPPAGFVVQSPARIALDFPGVVSGLARSNVEINQGNVRTANVAQGRDRTRVVLNLNRPTTYTAELQGRSVLVSLGAAPTTVAIAPATSVFAENQADHTQPLRDIDFRRSTDNAGRVAVDLPNNQVGVDIKRQGQNLVVEFLRSSLPEGLRRKLDVSDFGTPVQSITTVQSGDRVRMVIEPKGNGTYFGRCGRP